MRQTWSLLTFPPLKQAGTGPPVQPGLLANRGELSGLLQGQSRERVHRLASLSHCLLPSPAPQPIHSPPPPSLLFLPRFKDKTFHCKTKCRFAGFTASKSFSTRECRTVEKSSGLGSMPRTQRCNQPRAWRPSPLKQALLSFLPGTYSCLFFFFFF